MPRPRDDKLIEEFHALAIRLLRGMRKVDEAMGITPQRASALSVLVFRGPQSLGDLAAAEGVKAPTMSRLVKGMQDEGLVETEANAEDQRQIRIAATPKGRKILEQGRERRLAAIAERFSSATREERAALARVVKLMKRTLS